MRQTFFLYYGFLIWLPAKIAATALTVISLLATAGPAVDSVDVVTYINPLYARVAAVIPTDAGFTESKPREVPDPDSPTTDGPWSEMISATPSETAE